MTDSQPVAIKQYRRFSDDGWDEIVREVGVPFDLNPIRREVEFFLFQYAHWTQFPNPEFHVALRRDGKVVTEDLESAHARLAKAANEFLAAFDLYLHPGFLACRPNHELEFIYLREKVVEIANHSENEANRYNDRKRLKKLFPQFGEAHASTRGNNPDEHFYLLIDLLIDSWISAGGQLTASPGGPLSRFIRRLTAPALGRLEAMTKVRGWIRRAKELRNHKNMIYQRTTVRSWLSQAADTRFDLNGCDDALDFQFKRDVGVPS